MPSRISTARQLAYLRALADTGNASLAAARARVSRDWAYKKRKADAGFDGLCREMIARFRGSRAPLPNPSPAKGRGARRRRVNRDRVGGWTAGKEARFLERLAATCSVPFASAAVGLSAGSAYERRKVRPHFAAAWDEAERIGWPPIDQPWMEAVLCLVTDREPSPDNPVRITGIDDVLQLMKRNRFVSRRPRARRG